MARLSPDCRARQQGFTLVELLIAMTLLALLATLLFGAARSSTKAAAAGMGLIERSSDLTLVTGFLRETLADARPLPRGKDEINGPVDFAGREDGVLFVGRLPSHGADGKLERIEIRREHAQLVLRSPLPAAADKASETVLLDDVASITFAYFGALGNGRAEWHGRWDDSSVLPRLVRLRIAFADGVTAPDLVVALHESDEARR